MNTHLQLDHVHMFNVDSMYLRVNYQNPVDPIVNNTHTTYILHPTYVLLTDHKLPLPHQLLQLYQLVCSDSTKLLGFRCSTTESWSVLRARRKRSRAIWRRCRRVWRPGWAVRSRSCSRCMWSRESCSRGHKRGWPWLLGRMTERPQTTSEYGRVGRAGDICETCQPAS